MRVASRVTRKSNPHFPCDRATNASIKCGMRSLMGKRDRKVTLIKTLADIRHYCAVNGIDFDDMIGDSNSLYCKELEALDSLS